MTDSKSHNWNAEEYHSHSSAQAIAAVKLLKSLNLKGNERLIDVGCGDGKITAKIADNLPRGSILGIDSSPQMINFATSNFFSGPENSLSFKLQDAQQLNYVEEFDIVFSSFALQWLPNPELFFKGAFRALKKLGYLAVTIPLGVSSELEKAIYEITSLSEWKEYFINFFSGWHFLSEKRYRALLNFHQFTTIQIDSVLQEVIFSSRESFEKYVLQWLSYLNPLPNDKKRIFFDQVIDRYLQLCVPLNTDEVPFKFLRLDIIAQKIIP